MANPLYHQMMNSQPQNIMQRFNEFKKNFTGDPQQKVQEMLNSGRISQEQYNRAVQQAQQFQQMLNGR